MVNESDDAAKLLEPKRAHKEDCKDLGAEIRTRPNLEELERKQELKVAYAEKGADSLKQPFLEVLKD